MGEPDGQDDLLDAGVDAEDDAVDVTDAVDAADAPDVECIADADCADRDPCNGAEACVEGACVPGTPITGLTCVGDQVVICDMAGTAIGPEAQFCVPDAATGTAQWSCVSGALVSVPCAVGCSAAEPTRCAIEVTEVWSDDPAVDHPGTFADAAIDAGSPDTPNDGVDAEGGANIDDNESAWFRVDLGALPPTARVQSAELSLYMFSAEGDRQVVLYLGAATVPATSWLEDSATWNHYDGVTAWTAGNDGGAGDRGPVVAAQVAGASPGQWLTWSIDPSHIVAGAALNLSLWADDDNGADLLVRLSEWTTATERPRLTVRYRD